MWQSDQFRLLLFLGLASRTRRSSSVISRLTMSNNTRSMRVLVLRNPFLVFCQIASLIHLGPPRRQFSQTAAAFATRASRSSILEKTASIPQDRASFSTRRS